MELKRHGVELIGTCPFHEDKTPSLVVSPKTRLGDADQGRQLRHAVELLWADHPSLTAGEGRVVRKGYHATLKESP